MYRIVSRFLALFYFYLPPRLSFSLLLKRATNTLSLSLSSGEAKSLKKKKRFEREESSKTKRDLFSREILIQEFHLLKAKRRSSEHAHSRTHSKTPKRQIHFARSIIGTRALSFSSSLRSLSVRSPTAAPCTQKKSFLGEEISAPSIASSFLYRTCDARSHLALTKFPTFSRDEARRSRCF